MVPSSPTIRPKSVLIVEDDRDVRLVIQKQLERRMPGVEVHAAPDGPAALAFLARAHVDLILSDFRMPGMSGMDLLRQASREFPATHRIMLTGCPDEGLAIAASRDVGAERFFVKPLDFGALAHTILGILGPRRDATSRASARRGPLPSAS